MRLESPRDRPRWALRVIIINPISALTLAERLRRR
jgi:hypothetical protein